MHLNNPGGGEAELLQAIADIAQDLARLLVEFNGNQTLGGRKGGSPRSNG